MVSSTRILMPLLVIFLLFAIGESADSGAYFIISSIPAIHPLVSPGQPLFVAQAGVTPQTLRLAYGVNSLIQRDFTGKGQTVIDLVYFSSPTLQQDINVFDRRYNLPPIDLQVISPLNVPEQGSPQDHNGAAQEIQMDVEAIHAIAPGAKVIVLESPVAETQGIIGLPQFRQLEQYIIAHKLGYIVSQSWGASELTLQDTQGRQELQQWNNILQQGTQKYDITYFSSSGDSGAADVIDTNHHFGKVPTTSFAADSPWVTSVGGTNLSHTSSTFQETVWSNASDGSGSGGGFSSIFQMPPYQKMLPVTIQQQFKNRRGVPDISAVGDPNTGLPVYVNGQWSLGGGTSLSAPIWAGIQAIANQVAGHPLGFINPGLYKLGTSATYRRDFRDITEGNNSNSQARIKGYSAALGWDAATGLGTPNAEALIPDLIAALGPSSPTSTPSALPARVN